MSQIGWLDILLQTLEDALAGIERALAKTRFWQRFAETGLLPAAFST